MRNYIRLLVPTLLLLILYGCNNDFISLTGESAYWKGEYSARIENTSEHGEYIFNYKETKKDTDFNYVEVLINDETVRKEENFGSATAIKMEKFCDSCSVTDKNEPIKVTIKWNEENEETFYLKSQKDN